MTIDELLLLTASKYMYTCILLLMGNSEEITVQGAVFSTNVNTVQVAK